MPQLYSPVETDRAIRVLVVEDEVETLDLLVEFCRRQGVEVASARDGRAAMAAIARAPAYFDVVITDLNLPGADGFAVLNAARAGNPSCYGVIVTGYATIDSAVRAVREGAYDYLAKPFSLGQLEIVLLRIRDRMALERENRELMRRQPGHERPLVSEAGDLSARLQAIDDRLERIERTLREKT
jgi:DNA-binding NtrC family response regulator